MKERRREESFTCQDGTDCYYIYYNRVGIGGRWSEGGREGGGFHSPGRN